MHVSCMCGAGVAPTHRSVVPRSSLAGHSRPSRTGLTSPTPVHQPTPTCEVCDGTAGRHGSVAPSLSTATREQKHTKGLYNKKSASNAMLHIAHGRRAIKLSETSFNRARLSCYGYAPHQSICTAPTPRLLSHTRISWCHPPQSCTCRLPSKGASCLRACCRPRRPRLRSPPLRQPPIQLLPA